MPDKDGGLLPKLGLPKRKTKQLLTLPFKQTLLCLAYSQALLLSLALTSVTSGDRLAISWLSKATNKLRLMLCAEVKNVLVCGMQLETLHRWQRALVHRLVTSALVPVEVT